MDFKSLKPIFSWLWYSVSSDWKGVISQSLSEAGYRVARVQLSCQGIAGPYCKLNNCLWSGPILRLAQFCRVTFEITQMYPNPKPLRVRRRKGRNAPNASGHSCPSFFRAMNPKWTLKLWFKYSRSLSHSISGCYTHIRNIHRFQSCWRTREFAGVNSPAPYSEGKEKEGQKLKSSEAGHHWSQETSWSFLFLVPVITEFQKSHGG